MHNTVGPKVSLKDQLAPVQGAQQPHSPFDHVSLVKRTHEIAEVEPGGVSAAAKLL